MTERRKASPEQLNLLLQLLEDDKDLAIGKFTGLEGRIRQTNGWITITEKLNANSGFGSGATKTPDKWQQTWRDWKSNVRKKAFRIRKKKFTPGCNSNVQLTEAEEKILRLICNNVSAFGLSGVPETSAITSSATRQSHGSNDDFCNSDPSTSGMKWASEISLLSPDIDIGLDDSVGTDAEGNVGPSIASRPVTNKPVWRKSRPVSKYPFKQYADVRI